MAAWTAAIVQAVPLAGIWLLSAAGLGLMAARFLRLQGLGTALGLGIALMCIVDQWMGTLALPSHVFPRTVVALAALMPGWIGLVRCRADLHQSTHISKCTCVVIGIGLGAMLTAAMVPPGFFWSTEFGGYDVVNYHLQLPKEWLQMGAIRPLPHIANSGFPNFMEGAFLHLMSLRADPRDAALACQSLHAFMMVAAVLVVMDVVTDLGGDAPSQRLAAAAMLGTPWLIVTGSLAYSEAGVLVGMALAMRRTKIPSPIHDGFTFGLGVALAVGSKASSLAIVVPGVLLFATVLGTQWWKAKWLIAAIAACAVAWAPWLVRNVVVAGSPIFPLLGGIIENGWWDTARAARFDRAHSSDVPFMDRWRVAWWQWLAFGWGDNPRPGEPWRIFWGALPWVGTLATISLVAKASTRRLGVAMLSIVVVTLLGWMLLTHLQSRFLIPMVVPCALAIAMWVRTLQKQFSGGHALVMVVSVLWVASAPIAVVLDAPRQLLALGRVDLADGRLDLALEAGSDAELAQSVREQPSVEAVLNGWCPHCRVLCIGWSTPFWIDPAISLAWSNPWDENPFERALRSDNPLEWLRERFDVVVVDGDMLKVWERSRYVPADFSCSRVEEVLASQPFQLLLGGRRLYLLNDRIQFKSTATPNDSPAMPE